MTAPATAATELVPEGITGVSAPSADEERPRGGPWTLRRNFSEVRPIHVSERGSFFVLALEDGRFIKVSDDVQAVLEVLTADAPPTTAAGVVEQLRRDGRDDLSEDEVATLVEEVLVPQEILLEGATEASGLSSQGSRLWFHLKLFDGRYLAPLGRHLRVLFTRQAALAVAALWLVVTAALFLGPRGEMLLSSGSYRFSFLSFLWIVLPAAVIHELGHAFSCYRYGVQPRNMGIGLYLFRPVLFTDMSEAWLLDRRQRVITDLAGCYFAWIYLVVLSTAALFVPSASLLWAIILLYAGTLTNLNPFLRYDGYWVLTDLTGVVNVHRRAIAQFKYWLLRMLGRKPEQPKMPELARPVKRLLLALSCVYLVLTVALLTLGLWTLAQLVLDPLQRAEFFSPFGQAIRDGSVREFVAAVRSGGLVSIMFFYLLLMGFSVLQGFIAGLLKIQPGRQSPARSDAG